MDRHILGTFKNEEEAVMEIEKLLNEEGYSPEELMLVMDTSSQYDDTLQSIKKVRVNKVEVEEESMWDKVKEAFSFGTYEGGENQSGLEEYGVPHDRSEHYMEALRDGEIVLLADTDAPKHNGLSEVNGEIIEDKGSDEHMTDEKNTSINEVDSAEPEAIKSKDHSNLETSENKDLKESVDPSQADSTRKEDISGLKKEKMADKNEQAQGSESKEEPDLTGQEETVEKEASDHGYGNTVAEGVVKPEAKSPLNTDSKETKEAHENTEAPEVEANYSEELEEQGKKSLSDDK